MLRKFAPFFCVAALSVAFVGCEATEAPATTPATTPAPAAATDTMGADSTEVEAPPADDAAPTE